mgnify:CR=1 FL=1
MHPKYEPPNPFTCSSYTTGLSASGAPWGHVPHGARSTLRGPSEVSSTSRQCGSSTSGPSSSEIDTWSPTCPATVASHQPSPVGAAGTWCRSFDPPDEPSTSTTARLQFGARKRTVRSTRPVPSPMEHQHGIPL